MINRRVWLKGTALATAVAPLGVLAELRPTIALSATPDAASSASAPPDVTARLADYILRATLTSYPREVRHQGARTLLNWMAAALGGSRHEAVARAAAALTPFSGPPQAQLLGHRERFDALNASLLNGIAGHVLDYDDTHLKTIIHPATSVMPALLALSQYRAARNETTHGGDFLNALLIGAETECRIGNAVYPSHYDLGWHITGTCGVFGAAAACGRILGLTREQMISALGIAAAQPVGLKIEFGSMTKSFHPGRAAQNGLTAALLAQQGFTATAGSLEGRDGWGQAVSRTQNWSEVTEGLGTRFESALNTYKPFPCGVVAHPAIDAAIQLRNEFHLEDASIRRVTLHANPLVLSLTGKTAPVTGLDGKFSVYHCIAAAILFGAAGERQFTDAAVRDPRVVALRQQVLVETDPKIPTEQCTLVVELADGRRLERHIEHAVGSLERPMSDAQLEAKLRDLADGVLPPERITRLIELCWGIESLADATEIARTAAGDAGLKT